MGDGHLRQAPHEQQCHDRADQVTDEHAGAGEADRETTAEKQTGADRATDRDHRQLAARSGSAADRVRVQ
jgi:hypothetical protein